MVRYYWNKYQSILTNPYFISAWNNPQPVSFHFNQTYTWYTSYSFADDGKATGVGPVRFQIGSLGQLDPRKILKEGTTYYRIDVLEGIPVKIQVSYVSNTNVSGIEQRGYVGKGISSYTKGSLVQANIIGHANAYVNGGRNADGYWYERGAMVTIAPPSRPATPGEFTQPTGTLQIGDRKTIAWWVSSNSNHTTSRYVLEAAINGGAFTQIGTPTTNSFIYTIPTASRIQFRVKAVDARNLESSYRTSSVYPVTKPNYYWNQFKTAQGGLVQSGIVAEETAYPTNKKHSDGYWYVRGSRVNQAIAPPGPFTSPTQGKKFKPNETVNITFGASQAANLALYEVDFRYNSTDDWTPLPSNNTLTRSLQISANPTHKTLELRVRAKNTSHVYSDYIHSDVLTIEHNVAPTVSLRSPSGNVRLYENDTLNIEGTAFDPDADQSVTVYYQINEEPRKILATNLSQVRFPLTKQLTFKGGKLYNGKTAITGQLSEGTIQKLFVWAEDTEKGISPKIERRFSVVPNRAPLLSVDAVVPSGVVDTDTFKITGKASDDDANATVKVTSRINAGEPVEIYSGSGGHWEFEVALAQLVVGENTIVLEVVDNYGAKTSKTIKLNKKEVKTPILQSVARYQIEPPIGSAKGVLLFIQRDKELNIKVELSMTAKGEAEQYTVLSPVNTAPITAKQGVVEDTFEHKGMETKQRIVLKITPTRTDLASHHKIHLITGAVD
ncbi:hypothetical protein [Lysinibacillus sphaericus]|uniref:hypothetical protein n=1 Tax=Lysinibacillus sphaericus TaxID=1421 RepID=UPI003D7F683A